MDVNSRPVGTQLAFETRVAETALRELTHHAASATNRRLFAAEGQARRPCCFVTQLGTPCKNASEPGRRLCRVHLNECKRHLHEYQKACKPTPARAAQLYSGAKWLVTRFFRTLDAAQTFIVQLQNDVPVANRRRAALSLNFMESATQPLVAKYRRMTPDVQKEARRLAEDMYSEWSACWFGRMVYRLSCEQCRQDAGHVAAYYLFKAATLIGKIVRDDAA